MDKLLCTVKTPNISKGSTTIFDLSQIVAITTDVYIGEATTQYVVMTTSGTVTIPREAGIELTTAWESYHRSKVNRYKK